MRFLKKIYGHTVASLASVESSYYSLLAHLLGRGSRGIILIWLCLILKGLGASKCSHIAFSTMESLIGEDRLFTRVLKTIQLSSLPPPMLPASLLFRMGDSGARSGRDFLPFSGLRLVP